MQLLSNLFTRMSFLKWKFAEDSASLLLHRTLVQYEQDYFLQYIADLNLHNSTAKIIDTKSRIEAYPTF